MFLEVGVLITFAYFTGKQLRWNFFLIKLKALSPATLLKKTPTQMFSCELCVIFKNTFFYSTPRLDFSAISLAKQVSDHLLTSQ